MRKEFALFLFFSFSLFSIYCIPMAGIGGFSMRRRVCIVPFYVFFFYSLIIYGCSPFYSFLSPLPCILDNSLILSQHRKKSLVASSSYSSSSSSSICCCLGAKAVMVNLISVGSRAMNSSRIIRQESCNKVIGVVGP
jgi:hypothetical protein